MPNEFNVYELLQPIKVEIIIRIYLHEAYFCSNIFNWSENIFLNIIFHYYLSNLCTWNVKCQIKLISSASITQSVYFVLVLFWGGWGFMTDQGMVSFGYSYLSLVLIVTEHRLVSLFAGALSSVFLRSPQYLLACCGGSSPPPVFSSECFMPHQRCLSYSLSISSGVSHALHS